MVTAISLGLPHLYACLDSLRINFTHGANFATNAYTIGLPTSITPAGTFSPFYLYVQYSQFLHIKFRSHLLRQKGGNICKLNAQGGIAFQKLYTFDTGRNDLAKGFFFGNMTIEEVNASILDILNKFSINVKFSISSNFKGTVMVAQSLISYNDVAQYFNHKLKEAIVQLRKDLPSVAFTYVDVYSIKYSLFRLLF
uniref:Uncharacterized protein n=1 Tax=Quercus lobata TaxID=97700 RepID=A0A7N2R555_QUELO